MHTNRETYMLTYLTLNTTDANGAPLTVVYYCDRNLGRCHVAYYAG